MLQSQRLLSSNFLYYPTTGGPYLLPHSLPNHFNFTRKSITLRTARAARPETLLSEALPDVPTVTATATDEGPIEIPPSSPSIFAVDDNDASPLQIATSVLLTGAISIFLFRSLRRRAKRAKEMQFRSSGVKKSLKEEAFDSLKAMTMSVPGKKGPPSPIQTFLGGISAGVIALILYKFTLTIEGALNRQTLSDTYSVRQMTITIRTIVNGLCYLATFIFGFNSLGLFLLSGKLAFGGESSNNQTVNKDNESSQLSSNLTSTDSSELEESNDTEDGKQ
ncbi:uncharacterized protein LOC124946125 [Impatiens glandulifera]|uniref:uncharacterized protein LOC124946125 n=1 Tax=Impatiens glandulifera TaxID=253017 RepID=UPI001FB0D2D7|nr:uncharacterized protein LOC124946125 [Impatiens glandulifera]